MCLGSVCVCVCVHRRSVGTAEFVLCLVPKTWCMILCILNIPLRVCIRIQATVKSNKATVTAHPHIHGCQRSIFQITLFSLFVMILVGRRLGGIRALRDTCTDSHNELSKKRAVTERRDVMTSQIQNPSKLLWLSLRADNKMATSSKPFLVSLKSRVRLIINPLCHMLGLQQGFVRCFGTAGSVSWKTGCVEIEPGAGQTSKIKASLPCPDVPRTESYCSAPARKNSCRAEEIPRCVMGYYVCVLSIQ